MKKSDIASMILISGFAIIIGALIGNWIYGDLSNERATVTFITPISSTFTAPDSEIFNADAVNPTVPVIIGSDDPEEDITDGEDADEEEN